MKLTSKTIRIDAGLRALPRILPPRAGFFSLGFRIESKTCGGTSEGSCVTNGLDFIRRPPFRR
jgi:hypothetical protein